MSDTLKLWRQNDKLSVELAAQLTSPLWQAVFKILDEQSPARKFAQMPIQAMVGKGDALAGGMAQYEAAIENIRLLAKPPSVAEIKQIKEEAIEPTE